jgi:hypothetical protein
MHRIRGAQPLHRQQTALTLADVLGLPEIGVEIPVAELYEDVAFSPETEGTP